jgi:rRNA maturation endonuclease Nob1
LLVVIKPKRGVKMKTKGEPEGQEVKILILKCEKCGEEYIFDSTSRICPECGGILEKKEAVLRL